jgi:hypothetical protein
MLPSTKTILSSAPLLLLLVHCGSEPRPLAAPVQPVEKRFTGIYTVYTKGNRWGCETIIHYFDIQVYSHDSTFLYHAFCHPNNLDPTGVKNSLRPVSLVGRWTVGKDSLVRLQAFNGEVVKLKLMANGRAETYKDNGEQLGADLFFDPRRVYR